MYRHIKTTQELRANQGGQWIKDQGVVIWVKIRARRVTIPNAWDDIVRRDWKNRNWKRSRRHQYHVIDMT